MSVIILFVGAFIMLTMGTITKDQSAKTAGVMLSIIGLAVELARYGLF
jgi:hypothetical protein